MDKEDWINITIIGLILITFGVISYGIYIYDTGSFQCVENPIAYYESIKNVSCQCQKYNPYQQVNFSQLEIVR